MKSWNTLQHGWTSNNYVRWKKQGTHRDRGAMKGITIDTQSRSGVARDKRVGRRDVGERIKRSDTHVYYLPVVEWWFHRCTHDQNFRNYTICVYVLYDKCSITDLFLKLNGFS